MGNNPSLGQPESRLARGVGGSLRGPAGGGRGPRGTADRAAVLFRSLDASVASSMVGNSAGAHAWKEDEDDLVDEEAVEVSEDTGPLNIEEGKNGTGVVEEEAKLDDKGER